MGRIVHEKRALAKSIFPLLACFLMLFGQLAGLLHAVLVPHVRCAAHGELTHAEDGVHSDDASPLTTRSEVHEGHSDAHVHEHCTQLAMPSAAPSLATSSVAVHASLERASISAPHVRDVAAPQVALLLFAPKSSPPV